MIALDWGRSDLASCPMNRRPRSYDTTAWEREQMPKPKEWY